jgi:hypothetical protein
LRLLKWSETLLNWMAVTASAAQARLFRAFARAPSRRRIVLGVRGGAVSLTATCL